jgi:hypothetical protein
MSYSKGNNRKRSRMLPLHSQRSTVVAYSRRILLSAMRFYVFFGSILRVFVGLNFVGMRQVCVVSGFLMVTGFVMLGRFLVVSRSMFMMSCCLLVVLGCFL